MSENQTEIAPVCPVCKSELKDGTWPPSSAGIVIVYSGVFFLLVFLWYISGAFIEHPRLANDFSASAFMKRTAMDTAPLAYFRLYLPAVVGLVCLYWGWAVMTGRRALAKEKVLLCEKCDHAQLKL